jgi:hypothetical protein
VAEFARPMEIGGGWCFPDCELVIGGWKMAPSSPGANVKQEQKPSDEVMSSVRPSVDL